MDALLGLFSLLCIFLSLGYLLYCALTKNKNLELSFWLILLSLGMLFIALGLIVPALIFLVISIYKILTNPEAKRKMREYEKEQLEKQIDDKKRANELAKLQEELDKQNRNSNPKLTQAPPAPQTIIYNQPEDKKAGLFHSGVFCPYCRSLNVHFMHNNRKGFSVGKAIGGAALTGGIGSLAGFTGKKGKKNTWHCAECGRTFKSKK